MITQNPILVADFPSQKPPIMFQLTFQQRNFQIWSLVSYLMRKVQKATTVFECLGAIISPCVFADKKRKFDFLINGSFLRSTLAQYVSKNNLSTVRKFQDLLIVQWKILFMSITLILVCRKQLFQ